MEGNTVLHQLMSVRMDDVMNGITENDAFYQETKQRAEEYSDKLDALHLPRETKLLLGNPCFKSELESIGTRELRHLTKSIIIAQFQQHLHTIQRNLKQSGKTHTIWQN